MNFQKVNQGDSLKISASDFNAHQDTARYFKERGLSFDGPHGQSFNSNRLLVRNNTGADLSLYDVVELGDLVFEDLADDDRFTQRAFTNAIEPTNERASMGILCEPIADGELGWCFVSGICNARIETGLDAGDYIGFDIDANDTEKLIYNAPAKAKIIALQPDGQAQNDTVMGVVSFLEGTASVYDSLSEELSDTGTAETTGGRTVNGSLLKTGQSIPDGTWVIYECIEGVWEVTAAPCD